MQRINKLTIRSNFTKLDNLIFKKKNLSDAGFRLYVVLSSINPNKYISDSYLLKILDGWSLSKLGRAKKELKDLLLLSIKQISKDSRELYLASGDSNSEQVKKIKLEEYKDV